ncbi:hypothetical protein CEXT_304511 [Caerostris extrusa]|uniref:Uncharacterized protein n=1 Tax=Caerostris extrusa TaxID=172846 RepID=A0AAV4P948_CAEEX|nr:hypothetical protein CEXT_304511 [Caerostris extrusa]
MTNKTYDELWRSTQEKLRHILESETVEETTALEQDQMNIKIPAYFNEKTRDEQEKLSLIKELLRYLSNEAPCKYWESQRMTEKEALRIILTHEEARQGREAFLEAQRLFEIKEENRLKECRKI